MSASSKVYERHAEGAVRDVDESYIEGYADRMATARVPVLILGVRAKNKGMTVHGCHGIASHESPCSS